jgi:hypothetical protein
VSLALPADWPLTLPEALALDAADRAGATVVFDEYDRPEEDEAWCFASVYRATDSAAVRALEAVGFTARDAVAMTGPIFVRGGPLAAGPWTDLPCLRRLVGWT